MSLTLETDHLKRYKDILWLLLKYGRNDFIEAGSLDEAMLQEADVDQAGDGDPAQLARDLEDLGPTYIKLGQLLSTRPDLLSPAYIDALSRLQDDVEPIPYAEVEKIVTEELGVRMSKAFGVFESEPLAAGSLGQVHRATLRDGRMVAVKVQRPGIRPLVVKDLEALGDLVGTVERHAKVARRYNLQQQFEAFRSALLRELDFSREARNLVQLRENLRAYPNLVIPEPVPDYSTSRVLTMTYMDGTNVAQMGPLAQLELDGTALADSLIRAYLDQFIVHGFFHADPHPGNLLVTSDGQLALIDVGMVAHLTPHVRQQVLKLLLAVTEGKAEEAAQICEQMGQPTEAHQPDVYRRRLGELLLEHRNDTAAELQLGRVLMEATRITAACGIRPAPELAMVGRALLHLDEATRCLDPDFNPNEALRRHSESLMRQQMLQQLAPGNVFATVLEAGEFVRELPGRLNTLLDRLIERDLELKIHAFDEVRMMDNMQKIANRITLGLVMAALIIGAALLMRVPTSFTLFGYPGLAIILFLMAAVGGFGLALSIVLSDRRTGASQP